MQTDKYPLVDYHEWTPRAGQTEEPRPDWRTGGGVPLPRAPYGDDANSYSEHDQGAPTTGTGHRPGYDEPAYSGHGYWDDLRSDQQYGSAGPGQDQWPSAGRDATGSWRLSDLSDSRPALPATPASTPAVVGGSFDDDRDYPAVLWWTALWYAGPTVLYALLALVISSSSMRGHALHALVSDAGGGLFALVISLVVGATIRRTTLAGRAITVGFIAAVMGAGLATLIVSAF